MASKLQYYQNLSEKTASELTRNRGNWTSYLDTAARIYKYPFSDQLLIHAQKPDAIACASIELWNTQFNRWVLRGSKGLGLIDDSGGFPKIKYVFDVNDTEAARFNARPVKLWEMRVEHKDAVLAELAKSYEDVGGTLADSFRNIAKQLATEYYNDNTLDISYRAENSFLEPISATDFAGTPIDERDSTNLESTFIDALSESIAYTLMSRCGFDTDEYFGDENFFQNINAFDTTDMVYALGTATSELSQQVLRDIEMVIKKHERLHTAERTEEYDRNPYLQASGRLSAAGFNTIGIAGGTDTTRTLRNDAQSVSKGTPEHQLQSSATDGEIISALAGSGASGEQPIETGVERVNFADAITGQSEQSVGVDGDDEYATIASGGNGDARIDLRVVENSLSQVGKSSIEEILSTSAITIADVDSILRDGGNDKDSYLRIAARFAKDKSPEELTTFLRCEYLQGSYGRSNRESGKGFEFAGTSGVKNRSVSAWFDNDGISLAIGTTAKNSIHKITIPWEQAAMRVRELMISGNYVDRATFVEALDNERHELAGKLWHFYRDDMDFIPEDWNSEHGGYPEDEALIKSLLVDDDSRQAILDRVEVDVNQFNYDEHERVWNNPQLVLENMRASMLPTVIFPNDEYTYTRDFAGFITQDEIDAYLVHRGDEMKYRIMSNYLTGNGNKDFQQFLKESYGLGGGGTHALGGADNSYGDYSPSKGITLSRGQISNPFTKVKLNWNQAAKRVKSLIESGQFMTRAELDGISGYEKLVLAKDINYFFYDLPEEYIRPFEKSLKFYYPQKNEWNAINNLLGNIDNINALLMQMESIYVNTSDEDRFYSKRKTAFENLLAWRNGTFTLFPGIENLPNPETLAQKNISQQIEWGATIEPLTAETGEISEQFSLFAPLPTVEEQRSAIDQTLKMEAAEAQAISEILENDIDSVLHNISAADKARLYEQFANNPRSRVAVNLVKEIYGDTLPFPLPQVVKRIEELVAKGKFALDAAKPELHLQAVGDFYELTGDEAQIAADALGLTIAPRNGEPMVGFPKHVLDDYREQLSEAGYAVIVPEVVEQQKEVSAYKVSDTLWLDGRKFVVDEIGDYYTQPDDLARKFGAYGYSVSLTDITGGYPLSRSMYSAEVDYQLELDERYAAFAPIGEVTEQYAPEVTAKPVPPPDFDTVAQTIYDRVMADANFAYHLQFAQSRGALRSPLNNALDKIIGEMKVEEPAVYDDYFTDDIADDLFDYVYKTSWENRPQLEQMQPEPEQETPQFTEITDPTVIAKIDEIFPKTPQAEDTPIMVIDQAARQNYNLFALTFPRIVDGTYQAQSFKDENGRTLVLWHDSINAGTIHAEIAYYENGDRIVEPTMSLTADFDRRMLTAQNYANTRTGEDIGLMTIPTDTQEEKNRLTLKLANFLAEIRTPGLSQDFNSTWKLEQSKVFRDASGNELPAEPKANFDEFLKERANREIKAFGEVQRLMFYSPEEQEAEQNPGEIITPEEFISDHIIIGGINSGKNEPQIAEQTAQIENAKHISRGYVEGSRIVLDLRSKHTGLFGEFHIDAVNDDELTVSRDGFTEIITRTEAEQYTIQSIADRIYREPGTDYYLMRYPDGVEAGATFSVDELALITEYAKQYVICSEAIYLSEADMERFNIVFRKMPSDWDKLPSDVQTAIRNIKPEYETEWLELTQPQRDFEQWKFENAEQSQEVSKPKSVRQPRYERYEVRTVQIVEQISSNPQIVNLLERGDNGVRYGVYDNESDRFLFNNNDSYLVFATESEARAHINTLIKGVNFRITDDHLGEGGAKAKFHANLDAIVQLRNLENDNQTANHKQQEILPKYVGWGGLPQAFDPDNKDWAKEYSQLLELLTPDEYELARASTLNAHYTTPTVIKAMWETVERLGFKTGNILEPSMGIGNFYGLIPDSM
jgi:hypothetical protein